MKYYLLILSLLAAIPVLAEPTAALSQGGTTLVISKVSTNPKKHYPYLKPIANYMAKKMEDLGVTSAKVLLAKDNAQIIRYLRLGKIDWVTESPMTAMILQEKAGADLLLRKWKKGVPEYRTVFFTRKDSDIRSLADLKDKVITFQDTGSTSAYFVPAAIMLKAGLELVQLDSIRDRPPAGKVGYFFTPEEINMSTLVNKKLMDAGAYADLDWSKNDHNPRNFREQHMIFYQSKPYPRAIEIVNRDLPDKTRQRLKQLLLHIHEDDSATAILHAYQRTKKFDELDESILKSLSNLRKQMKVVQQRLD